jgi:hypothetical protein
MLDIKASIFLGHANILICTESIIQMNEHISLNDGIFQPAI